MNSFLTLVILVEAAYADNENRVLKSTVTKRTNLKLTNKPKWFCIYKSSLCQWSLFTYRCLLVNGKVLTCVYCIIPSVAFDFFWFNMCNRLGSTICSAMIAKSSFSFLNKLRVLLLLLGQGSKSTLSAR